MGNEWKRYLEFVEQRAKRPENCGRSFTYGNAMYSFITEWRGSFSWLGIQDRIVENIVAESWASYDWVEWLSDEALAEIVDISELDDYGREINDEYQEEILWEIEEKLEEYNVSAWKSWDELIDTVYDLIDEYWYEWGKTATMIAEDFTDCHTMLWEMDEDLDTNKE